MLGWRRFQRHRSIPQLSRRVVAQAARLEEEWKLPGASVGFLCSVPWRWSLLSAVRSYAAPQASASRADRSEGSSEAGRQARPTRTRTSLTRRPRPRRRGGPRPRRRGRAPQRDAMTPRFKRDMLGNLIPDVRAAAAIIFDPQTGESSGRKRARSALDRQPDQDHDGRDVRRRRAGPDAARRGHARRHARASVTYLRAGESISLRRPAAPDADRLRQRRGPRARADVRRRHGRRSSARMNEMAAHLGLTNTHYADPSGPRRAQRLVGLRHVAPDCVCGADATLGPIMRTSGIRGADEPARDSRSTAPTSCSAPASTCVGGKTGFISKAGYCLATLLQVPQGPQVAVVVLGAANSTTRFWEARHLFNWVVGRSQGLVGGDRSPIAPSRHSQQHDLISVLTRSTLVSFTLTIRCLLRPRDSRPRSTTRRPDGRVRGRAVGQDRRAGGRRRRAAGALDALGHDVTVVMPRYRGVDRRRTASTQSTRRVGSARRRTTSPVTSSSCRTAAASSSSTSRVVRSRRALRRRAAATTRTTRERFALLAAAALDFAEQRRRASRASTSCTRTTGRPASCRRWLRARAGALAGARRAGLVLTIHNLAYQGLFPRDVVPRLGLAVGRVHDGARRVLGAVQFSQGGHHRRRLRHDGQSDLRATRR